MKLKLLHTKYLEDNHKKEWSTDTGYYNMNEPPTHYAKWKNQT
jgi:hypothetical protein